MAEVTCPQCGTVADIEEGQHTFCANCDFPLFWAGRNENRNGPATPAAVRGGEVETGEQITDVICRACGERNPGDRAFCLKCGSELTRAEEDFDPDLPPAVTWTPAEQPKSSRVLRPLIAVVVLAVLVGAGFFGYREVQGKRVPPVFVTVLDASGDTGYDTALEVGNGAPVIAYGDAVSKALRYIHCKTATCAGNENEKIALVTQGDPAHNILMDLAQGAPIVVYRDAATKSLRTVRCGTFACDNAQGTRRFGTIEDGTDVGYDSAMAVGGGIPIVTYRAASNGSLKAALLCATECSDDDGPILERGSANGRVIVTLVGGTDSDTGYQSAVAIPTGGTPYVAYRDAKNKSLRLLHCKNRSCSQHDDEIILAAGDIGYDTAMVIGQNAFPIIATRNNENSTLVVYACGDVVCSQDKRTENVVDNGGADGHKVGFNIAMALGPNGDPIIVYRDDTAKAMQILRCGDPVCTVAKRTISKLDPAAGTDDGFDVSMRAAGGLLNVAYRDATMKALKFARVKP